LRLHCTARDDAIYINPYLYKKKRAGFTSSDPAYHSTVADLLLKVSDKMDDQSKQLEAKQMEADKLEAGSLEADAENVKEIEAANLGAEEQQAANLEAAKSKANEQEARKLEDKELEAVDLKEEEEEEVCEDEVDAKKLLDLFTSTHHRPEAHHEKSEDGHTEVSWD
jgi:hypothetical protein